MFYFDLELDSVDLSDLKPGFEGGDPYLREMIFQLADLEHYDIVIWECNSTTSNRD